MYPGSFPNYRPYQTMWYIALLVILLWTPTPWNKLLFWHWSPYYKQFIWLLRHKISSFRVAGFIFFVFSHGVISSFRLAFFVFPSFRMAWSRLFAWRLFAATRRNGTIQPLYYDDKRAMETVTWLLDQSLYILKLFANQLNNCGLIPGPLFLLE